jgi:hypothetical protein
MSNQASETAYYFDSALMPPNFVICGVKLRPFCLGHYLILRHLKNPVISEDIKDVNGIEGIYWILHAIVVCALTYEQNLELLQDDNKLKETFEGFCENFIKLIDTETGWNIHQKLTLFKQYLAYHFSIPMYEEEIKDEAKPTGIDWTQGIYTILKQDLGYTESEILNMAMRKLFYEWCSIGERNGCLKVFSKTSLTQYAVAKGLIKPKGFVYNKVETKSI